ncbi:MAG: rhodanese-like domain-containing protein [Thermodesulfobacteriota bacterium]
MVKVAFTGELAAFLEKHREERRALQFQKVKTISLESTYRLWGENKTLFIDARPAEDYRELHVDQAINFPPEKWDELKTSGLAGLKRDRQILVYCSNKSCDDALILAEKLQALGFSRVLAFTGGFRAWDEAGYPVDTSL